MAADKGASKKSEGGSERRGNLELRERLDQIMDLARQLYREASTMSSNQLEQARDRIEWLAQEIWEAAVYGPLEERSRPTLDDSDDDEDEGFDMYGDYDDAEDDEEVEDADWEEVDGDDEASYDDDEDWGDYDDDDVDDDDNDDDDDQKDD